VRSNRILLAIIAVELFWGFGMVSFEGLMPVRLAEVVDSSDGPPLSWVRPPRPLGSPSRPGRR
ncbi:MAG: hypothetical protein ABR609_12690, partial [Acidimicrobiia bacterium]